jgi:hypothetical protein
MNVTAQAAVMPGVPMLAAHITPRLHGLQEYPGPLVISIW